jgi:O-antigen/teichoic acid export membrane protein
MRASFIRGVSFFFALNILIKPIWVFGIDMAVQNTLGPEVYGGYFAVLNLCLMFAILLDLGINMSNTRNVAGETVEIRDHFSSLLGLRLLLFFLFMLSVGGIAIVLGYDVRMLKMLAWLGVNQFLLASLLFLRSYVGGLRWFTWDAFLSVADKLFMVILIGILLYGFADFQLSYFIGGQTLAYTLALLIALVVLRKQLANMSLRPKMDIMRKRLKEALPYATLILLMGLYTRMDGVMIERMRGEEASGMYAGAFRLLDVVIQIGVLFSFVLIPVFTRKLQLKAFYGTLMRSSFNLLLSISLSITVVSVFFHRELIEVFYRHATPQMALTFAFLMASLPAFYLGYLFGSALTAGGQTKVLNRIAVGGLLVNFFLNLIAIYYYGELGAAVTTLITQWTAALLQMYSARKIYRIRIASSQWMSLGMMMLSQWIIFSALMMYFSWQMSLLLGGLVAMTTPFWFRLIQVRRLLALRQ